MVPSLSSHLKDLYNPKAFIDHAFEPEDPTSCFLEDHVEYALPAGPLGDGLDGFCVRDRLRRMFAYRHATTAADLAAHARFADRPPLTIAISGASGLIGSTLAAFLTAGGHRVRRIVRAAPREAASDLLFRADMNQVVPAMFEGLDAVVHLAGESIASGRWTPERKQRIRSSRVDATRALCAMLSRLASPPKVLVCASAIGFYGDRRGEILDENASPGRGFLADACREWEAAVEPARQRGIRVVSARFGMVLSPRGGALASMLIPFRLGLGGRTGDGRQHWSWISIDDAVGAIHHAIMTDSLQGPMNATSPGPVGNQEFADTLSGVLRRPALVPTPAAAVRLVLGEMATELLLADIRVVPRLLEETGYRFRHGSLESALRHVLGRMES